MRINLGSIDLNDEERRLVWFGLGEDYYGGVKALHGNVRTYVRMLLREALDEQRSILAEYDREAQEAEACS